MSLSTSSTSSFTADLEKEYAVGLLETKHTESGAQTQRTPTRWSSRDQSKRTWRDSPYLALTIVVLAITNIATISAVIALITSRPQVSPPLNHPPGGPAKALLELVQPAQPTRLSQPFWKSDHNVLKEHASDKADAAWDDYTLDDSILFYISKEDAAQADIDPEKHAYVDNPEKGQVGYVAAIEVTHQLHCLDMMRRSLYYNINHTRATCKDDQCPDSPKYKDEKQFETYIQNHLDHCVDLIRQRLACTSDLGLIPFMWVGTQGRLFPDTNRTHTCHDYNTVHRWGKKKLQDFPTPGGAVKPKPGEFYLKDYI